VRGYHSLYTHVAPTIHVIAPSYVKPEYLIFLTVFTFSAVLENNAL